MADRLPRAVRPLQSEYITIGKIVADNNFYYMTRIEFVKLAMRFSHGFGNPKRYSDVYDLLMEDGGLPALGEKKDD